MLHATDGAELTASTYSNRIQAGNQAALLLLQHHRVYQKSLVSMASRTGISPQPESPILLNSKNLLRRPVNCALRSMKGLRARLPITLPARAPGNARESPRVHGTKLDS